MRERATVLAFGTDVSVSSSAWLAWVALAVRLLQNGPRASDPFDAARLANRWNVLAPPAADSSYDLEAAGLSRVDWQRIAASVRGALRLGRECDDWKPAIRFVLGCDSDEFVLVAERIFTALHAESEP